MPLPAYCFLMVWCCVWMEWEASGPLVLRPLQAAVLLAGLAFQGSHEESVPGPMLGHLSMVTWKGPDFDSV